MKKLLVIFALLLLFTLPASAAQGFYIYDEADLLTDAEEAELSELAEKISLSYECSIHFAAVEDYSAVSDAGSITEFAEEFYHSQLLGYGTERNGILLILSMEERDYDLCAYGASAHASFTDYGKEVLSEEFLDDFGYDDWYSGAYDYITGCDYLLSEAEYGTPVDTIGAIEQNTGTKLLIVFAPALIIALIVCLIFLAQMKTARRRINGAEYVSDYGTNLYIRQDIFTHRTTQQRVIESNSGGTKTNSGGFSHRSGKF